VVQDKRYPYRVTGAVSRALDSSASNTALPNSDVVVEAHAVNRAKHPMGVSKLSVCRMVERCWATNQKGDMSKVDVVGLFATR
jgi:hypothetical protein